MSAKQTFSPLERILGDNASATHALLDGLMRQVEVYCDLPPEQQEEYRFNIPQDEALVARDELHSIIAGAETQIDDCAETFKQQFFDGLPVAKIYVARGHCDKQLLPVSKEAMHLPTKTRYIIGKDIGELRFKEIIESTDHRLSEVFRPICELCGTDKDHATTLSYTRLVHSHLLPYFDATDAEDRELIQIKWQTLRNQALLTDYVKNNMTSHIRTTLERLERLKEEKVKREDRRAQAEGELRDVVANLDSPYVFLQPRIKGGGRIMEKIIRFAADRFLQKYLDVSDLPGVNDIYGIKIITRDAEGNFGPESIKDKVISTATERYGEGTVCDVLHDERTVGGQVVFDAWKMMLRWGNNSYAPSINVQVQNFMNYRDDQKDHPFYEERQFAKLQEAIGIGFPAKQLREELGNMF